MNNNMNSNYNFWRMAFDMRAIDISLLREAVITEENPFGEITEDQFKTITNVDFIVKQVDPLKPSGTENSNSEVKEPENKTA